MRPMRGVETSYENVREDRRPRRGLRHRLAIKLRDERKIAGAQMFPKSPDNRLKRWQLERLEVPARHLESIERAKKMIGRAHDRFGRKIVRVCFLLRRSSQGFFRRNRKQQSEMLAQRQRTVFLPRQQVSQPGRSKEMNAEMRLTLVQQPGFQRMRMASRRYDDQRRQRLPPRDDARFL